MSEPIVVDSERGSPVPGGEADLENGLLNGCEKTKTRYQAPCTARDLSPRIRIEDLPVRSRKEYDPAPGQHRSIVHFCPKAQYRTYMMQIDELIRIEDELNAKKVQLDATVGRIYRSHGHEHPRIADLSKVVRRQKQYNQVISAYFEIRRRLRDRMSHKKPDFDNLVASLEIVGAIIINPHILSFTMYDYSDEEQESPWLTTNVFASEWTRRIIHKISWPIDEVGLFFHTTEEFKTRLHYNGDD